MALDIVPGPVSHGSPVAWGLASNDGTSVLAGGVPFDPPNEKLCKVYDADGVRCGGYASGEDRRCIGHRRAAKKEATAWETLLSRMTKP